MTLWGKTMAEIDEDHRRMLADRLAREQAATPQQLGRYFGSVLQPYEPTQQERIDGMLRETAVCGIPRAAWREVEDARDRTWRDDADHSGRIVIWGLVAVLASVGLLVIVIALR